MSSRSATVRNVLTRPTAPDLSLVELSASSGSEKARPPILMLHGYTAGAWMFSEKAMPRLSAAGWDCYALDLRGHGQSEGRDEVRSARYVDYLDDVRSAVEHVTAVAGQAPILIGHSLGSVLARDIAAQTKLPGLVLAGFGDLKLGMKSFIGWMMVHFPLRTMAGMATGRSSKMWSLYEPQYRTLFDEQPRDEVERWVSQFQIQPESDKVFMDLMGREMPTQTNDAEVHVIAGNNDPVAKQAAVNKLGQTLSTVPIIIEGAAHDLFLGCHADEALDHILKWLHSFEALR